MKKVLAGSTAASLGFFLAGTILLWRVLRVYTVDVLAWLRLGR